MRIGYGWDSHAFKPGVPLKIGGLALDHPEGLYGHSDGDVLLHAITDALLGAVAAGDIGSFFPPGDARWKNADSSIFLETALEEIRHAGYAIANVDTTLVLAAPKIGPIAEKLRENVATLLHLEPRNVGIKAKTPEGLNQDHVAVAHAVVLLEKLENSGQLGQMAASADSQKSIEDVVRKLLGESIVQPTRKPAFDTEDIT
ncbi:MAG TPA: 2-C-methyl-D-erythritol 2,4-cyclodiphosphate synthase [Acidobacteriaceae bacterium]|jgi:2-C-methyl-D-erythritol 2,4-cyclodiphosphate synthase|nr:2-C-methyl-D-erythritol 2,4-cyclodiphosphate synthase [Acidobacteriaceae bacterium]